MIPSAASVYVQIIDSPLISSWNKLLPIHVDSDKVINPPKNIASCPGSAAVHDIQMSQLPKDQFHAVTDPVCVFRYIYVSISYRNLLIYVLYLSLTLSAYIIIKLVILSLDKGKIHGVIGIICGIS